MKAAAIAASTGLLLAASPASAEPAQTAAAQITACFATITGPALVKATPKPAQTVEVHARGVHGPVSCGLTISGSAAQEDAGNSSVLRGEAKIGTHFYKVVRALGPDGMYSFDLSQYGIRFHAESLGHGRARIEISGPTVHFNEEAIKEFTAEKTSGMTVTRDGEETRLTIPSGNYTEWMPSYMADNTIATLDGMVAFVRSMDEDALERAAAKSLQESRMVFAPVR